jgi:hypothetical protein
MVESYFHLAKHEDGRRDGRIHIVYGITVLAKSLSNPSSEDPDS